MNLKNASLLLLLFAVLTACGFSYSRGSDVKMKSKTINGHDYLFMSRTQSTKKGIGLFRSSETKKIIDFTGLDKPIHKTIPGARFSEKTGFNSNEFIFIDSISFMVYDNRNRVDLCYYLDYGNQKKLAVFTLEKENGDWKLK